MLLPFPVPLLVLVFPVCSPECSASVHGGVGVKTSWVKDPDNEVKMGPQPRWESRLRSFYLIGENVSAFEVARLLAGLTVYVVNSVVWDDDGNEVARRSYHYQNPTTTEPTT